jgi:hypothetical protein
MVGAHLHRTRHQRLDRWRKRDAYHEWRSLELRIVDREDQRDQITTRFHQVAHLGSPVWTRVRWDRDEEPMTCRYHGCRAPSQKNARIVVYDVEPLVIGHGELEEVARLEGHFAHGQVRHILEETDISRYVSMQLDLNQTNTYRLASSIAVREISMPRVSSPSADAR